ncbi:CBS domain-containing protein [Blastococcus sp. CCUG 61487]|uniref:CBS domain-containing protein n=1 Tax=Blastococcus sp. CCUG 61487 TaxID=1840703 RepID=UPI0010C070BB|nr:CBS domain-containing protein [Blastococcus sp. CCUG 61487]
MTASVDRNTTAGTGAELAPRPRSKVGTVRPLTVPAPVRVRRTPRTAADVMTRFPLTVHHGDSMWTAWDRISGAPDRHLVVVDDHRRPVGVLDDRTLAMEWPAGPLAAQRTPVHTLLRGRPRPRVRSTDSLPAVARVLVGAGTDAVPVVDRAGRLFGLITLWHFAELAARAEEPAASDLDG